MGCVTSNSASTSLAGQGASSVTNQRLDAIPVERANDPEQIHLSSAGLRNDLNTDASTKYTPRTKEHGFAQGTLLAMAMESAMDGARELEQREFPTNTTRWKASSHDIAENHLNSIPDVAYSIRDPRQSSIIQRDDSSQSPIGSSLQPGLSKNVVVNRPTVRNLNPGGVNDEFQSHGGPSVAATQPIAGVGLRGIPPTFRGQPVQTSFPSVQRAYPLAGGTLAQPYGVVHLAPLDNAAYNTPMLYAPSQNQQLRDLDNSVANAVGGRGRGRGVPALGVAPTPAFGVGGFRGPMIPVGVPVLQPGRAQIGFVIGRGRGQQLQIAIPGIQHSHRGDLMAQPTESTVRDQRTEQFLSAICATETSGRESISMLNDDAGDDEDNDDIIEDDEEVQDWGLESGPELAKTPPTLQTHINHPKVQDSTRAPAFQAVNEKVASTKTKTLGRELDLEGAQIKAVDLGDGNEDDSDDDIGGDGDNDGDAELHDWLETDPETLRRVPTEPTKVLSAPPSEPQVKESRTTSAISPSQDVTAKTKHSPLAPSPTRRLPQPLMSLSPHPPLPAHQASLRQVQALAIGNTSPTRPAGPPPLSGSPVKPPSYRSNIVTSGVPPLLPHLNAIGSPTAGPIDPSKDQNISGIRDTKVVKKKRAELPRSNLPHPAPKFGDWLNSRTMINNYIILESLGAGSYAEVKLCKEKASGKLFAMKFINRDVMKKDKLGKQSKLDDIKREIAIMKKLNHPNVLRLYEVMDDPSMNKLFLVLEYMKHGDLLSHQKKKHQNGANEHLHDRDLHCVTLQVILGLAYLHEQKIVHGDIKPQNLLVGDKDIVKIADFGISQSLYGSKQKLSDTAGTPAFMSPEMCSGQEYSGQLADIWAVGATVFMLKYGEPPFVAKSAMQMFERIQNDPLVFPGPIDPMLEDLLRGMLTKDPSQRMTLLQIMTHPWATKEEHPSHFALREKTPQITVTNDEVENAIDPSDKFAIIVNIRVQMMKRLQQSRAEILRRRQAAGHDYSSADKILAAGFEHDHAVDTQHESQDEGPHSGKTVKKVVPKVKSNKIFVEASGGHANDGRLLSSEEITYRSQLFSRKKVSGVAGMNGASSAGFPRGGDRDDHQTHDLEDANRPVYDDGEDENDVVSDDDEEDDEQAVSQSPQLLDELLLTTLSMPPLTKTSVPRQGNTSPGAHSSSITTPSLLPVSGTSAESSGPTDTQCFHAQNRFLNVTVAVSSLQGRRNTQEDRWTVLTEITKEASSRWSNSLFAGLYDGHGGDECAGILQDQLHAWLFRAPDSHFTSPERLQNCLLEFDSFLCDYLLHKGDLSGSTATWLLVDHTTSDPSRGLFDVLVGHVGDCRLVLSRHDGTVVDITSDHRLTLAAERERVLELGGRVVNNRVNGVMAITRAFGDLEFKGQLGRRRGSSSALLPHAVQTNPFHDERTPALLTARPDVLALRADAARDEFLLLACDGLWDVLSSEQAAELLRDRLHFHGDLQLAATELAQEAIRRYSNDNISVVVVRFA